MEGMEHQNNQIQNERASGSVAAEQKDKFLPISILIAAVVIAGALVFASLYKGGSSAAPAAGTAGNNNPTVAGPAATTTPAALMTLGPRDAILGNANAPVTIVEYGDYQCPFCTRFFTQTEPQIIQNYVDTGKARFVFRDFAFLGPESTAAANAAQCAEDQNKLWSYHDALYAAKVQDEAKGGSEDDGFFNRTLFLKLAGQVGLNIPTFTSCIDGSKDASAVSAEVSAAQAGGVNSTPTFLVNGQQIQGAEPYATFSAAIDAAAK
jgi:protein-disulfide isomerase